MSYKLMPRLGSAIASTILSVFWAVSLVGVDKAQAAVLTYNFQIENNVGGGFFKVDNSSLTGIGYEKVAVSEGRLHTDFVISDGYQGQDYDHPLRLSTLGWPINAVFYQGDFLGLQGSRGENGRYKGSTQYVSWSFDVYGTNPGMWTSSFSGYSQIDNPDVYKGGFQYPLIKRVDDAKVSYTLVDPAPEPVPEPLTAGGTALALAGLSWLKHKTKVVA
jgi:hypothetical protein